MNQFIGCDTHKRFCVFAVMKENGEYEPVELSLHDPAAGSTIKAKASAAGCRILPMVGPGVRRGLDGSHPAASRILEEEMAEE